MRNRESDVDTYEKAIKQLLLILASDQENHEDIIAVPDENLAKNQLDAILTRNKNMNKLADTINELKLEITYLQKEGENKDQNL